VAPSAGFLKPFQRTEKLKTSLFQTHLQFTLAISTRPASPPAQRSTTINLNSITSHMRTRLRTQEQHQSAKIARLANAARRLSRGERLAVLLKPEVRHTAGEDAGADDVDHDVLGCKFGSRHLGEVDGCWRGHLEILHQHLHADICFQYQIINTYS
jgi:hypothetical protein